ncbi:unnamed protein product [Trifolium pratense]|uniref:Uncharacterized protein n=1 Tax=Trifolium pratense TaxID=57577 RepID=A0ACB0M0T5_TRIPR|nr:unnamed protein product [Trifolium pratense]
MRDEDLQNGEIRVPKEYVELHWKSVSNPVVFILPNGATQKIYWVKRNGDIWFQKNWEKFAKFLKFRFKVNFEYIGGSYFKIEIYGVNTLEIDYSNIKFIDEVNAAENRNEVEEAIEVSDDSDKSLDESELPTQTQRTKNGKRKMAMDSNANHQNISGSNRGDMNKKAKKCSTSKANNGRGRKRGGMIKERTRIISNKKERTRNYRSRDSMGGNRMKDFTFEILVKENYPDLPKEFINISDDTYVELKMERKSWSVLVKHFHSFNVIRFGYGWRPFIKECNLIGKVCSFELIDEEKFVFNVLVARKNHGVF